MKRREVIAVIPARYHSTRLPGKALLEIDDIPMVVHVIRRAAAARSVSRVIVATDDQRIEEVVQNYGGEAMMTSSEHQSGTDRVAEVARLFDCDLVVNLQGDEPLIDPEVIDAAVAPFDEDPTLAMSTTREGIDSVEEVLSPNVVKVVTDERGYALCFTRSPIPYPRARIGASVGVECEEIRKALERDRSLLANYSKHTGLYVYRRDVLLELAALPPSKLELLESLEQLRALEHGVQIRVVTVRTRSIAVDTAADLEKVRNLIAQRQSLPAETGLKSSH